MSPRCAVDVAGAWHPSQWSAEVIYTCDEAVREALLRRGHGDLWWGARVLDAWPHVVGLRFAEKAQPILPKSHLQERGLLVVSVPNSSWMQELSFLNIGDRMNDALGNQVIRDVRFEVLGGRR